MTHIKTIELHFSNRCTGNCRICSKKHGGFHQSFADNKYVDKIIDDLKEIKCDVLQTGGDGDAFLHPKYIDYLRKIKKAYPNQRVCLYTSMFSFTPERADIIVREKLLDEVNLRLDTIQPELYRWHTGFDFEVTMRNIRHFRKINDCIDFTVIYFPLYKYVEICRRELGKEPVYFKEDEVRHLLKNEEYETYGFIRSFGGQRDIMTRRSGVCLWAERINAKSDYSVSCKHLPEVEGAFTWQCLVYPNGDVGLCAYDDGQDTFVYGNIFKEALADIWNSDRKKSLIDAIRAGAYTQFPCNNRKCCYFYD